MKTLPKEPWRGSQICGWRIAYGLPWSIYCGEFKKLGSPLCEVHDKKMREENGGTLPRFAPGNAVGLRLTSCSQAWLVRDQYDDLVAGSTDLRGLQKTYGFTLSWENEDPDKPQPATPEEIAAWEAQS
jgi:hypothetical protein